MNFIGSRENDFYKRRPILASSSLELTLEQEKDLEILKGKVNIIKVIRLYMKLYRPNKNWLHFIGLCPFHVEKTPSFGVNLQKQIFHCWGCGEHGDVFKFVQIIEGCSFPEAIAKIKKISGIKGEKRYGNVYNKDYFTLAETGDEYSQRVLDIIYNEKEIKYSLLHGKSYKEITGLEFGSEHEEIKDKVQEKPIKGLRLPKKKEDEQDLYKIKCEFVIKMCAEFSDILPNSKQIFTNLIENKTIFSDIKSHIDSIKGIEKHLFRIKKEFGDEIFVKTLLIIDKYQSSSWRLIARTIGDGNEKNLVEILDFTKQIETEYHLDDWDLKRIIESSKEKGKDDIEKGLKFAQEFFKDEEKRLIQISINRFILCCSYVGFNTAERLVEHWFSKGVSKKLMSFSLLFSLIDHEGSKGCINNISKCIDELLDIDLDVDKYTSILHQSLYGGYPKAKVEEAREVLKLIKKYNIEDIDAPNLRVAISYYRQPSKRSIIEILFGGGSSRGLTFASMYEGLSSLGAYFGEDGVIGAQKIFFEQYKKDAAIRTHELMEKQYTELGVFSFDKVLVEDLASNPLFVKNISGYKPIKSIGEIFDSASKKFGNERIKKLIKGAEPGTEIEYIMALLEIGNFGIIDNIFNKNDTLNKLAIARSINKYGFETANLALEITKQTGLNPLRYLDPSCSMLKNGNKLDIGVYKKGLLFDIEVLTQEQENQFRTYLNLPFEKRKNIGRAVNLYKRIFNHTLNLLKSSHFFSK